MLGTADETMRLARWRAAVTTAVASRCALALDDFTIARPATCAARTIAVASARAAVNDVEVDELR